jgi:signal peptidase II
VSPCENESAMTDQPAASAAPEPTAAAGPQHRTGRAKYLAVMAGCAAFAYLFDQLTKWWVVGTMTEGQIIPVLPPVLNWHFIRNPGAAFSIGSDFTWVFSIVQAVVPLVVFWLSRRLGSMWWSIAFGLLAGGALGNLTDRLFREPSFGLGHVVDFIALPNFAVFNIADSAVVGAVILICVLTLRGIGVDGRQAAAESPGRRSADGPDGDHA